LARTIDPLPTKIARASHRFFIARHVLTFGAVACRSQNGIRGKNNGFGIVTSEWIFNREARISADTLFRSDDGERLLHVSNAYMILHACMPQSMAEGRW
jgi:hypothetical protein